MWQYEMTEPTAIIRVIQGYLSWIPEEKWISHLCGSHFSTVSMVLAPPTFPTTRGGPSELEVIIFLPTPSSSLFSWVCSTHLWVNDMYTWGTSLANLKNHLRAAFTSYPTLNSVVLSTGLSVPRAFDTYLWANAFLLNLNVFLIERTAFAVFTHMQWINPQINMERFR